LSHVIQSLEIRTRTNQHMKTIVKL
jgi:hypothetical protein